MGRQVTWGEEKGGTEKRREPENGSSVIRRALCHLSTLVPSTARNLPPGSLLCHIEIPELATMGASKGK